MSTDSSSGVSRSKSSVASPASLSVFATKRLLGPVNHANRPLEAALAEQFRRGVALVQIDPEARDFGGVKKLLVAPAQAGPDTPPLGGIAPIARRGDGARVSAEADPEDFAAES